jgi:hypothetical protein
MSRHCASVDTKAEEDAQRQRQIRYYRECAIPALPGAPPSAPPSYRYFVEMVERWQKVKPGDLTENSVLLGSPERTTETLAKVEAAGFSEVILYVNVGLKPHTQVKEEMARFMSEVAPNFDGSHRSNAAVLAPSAASNDNSCNEYRQSAKLGAPKRAKA